MSPRYRIIGPSAADGFLLAARLKADGTERGQISVVCRYCFDPVRGSGGVWGGGVCSAACDESLKRQK